MKTNTFLMVLCLCVCSFTVNARVLVQESFPIGEGAYPTGSQKLNATTNNQSGDGIVGFATGWTTGSANTGVFLSGPNGLVFPEGIGREPEGSGTGFMSHPQMGATDEDYGRILGRRTDTAAITNSNGTLYMSVLIKTDDAQSLDVLAEGHWRMMGMSPTAVGTNTADLMNDGVYLGITKKDGVTVNALKVGTAILPLSSHIAGQTYFLQARIDLFNYVVHAREITGGGVTDDVSEYAGSLPLSPDYVSMLLSYMVMGGDYALRNTSLFFDEFRVSTTFAEQVGVSPGAYALGDFSAVDATDSSISGSIALSSVGTDGILVLDFVDPNYGTTNTLEIANPVLGNMDFAIHSLKPGMLYQIYSRIEENGAPTEFGPTYQVRTTGIGVLPESVLVHETFPVSETAYRGARPDLKQYPEALIAPGIVGLASGWAFGDTGTGVFHINADNGLLFPEGIPRDPMGQGAVYFGHTQINPVPSDYGRILGCATAPNVSTSLDGGVYYMSVLTRTPFQSALNPMAEGHWRMMGLSPNCVVGTSAALMNSGIYLGIAKIDGQIVNALKVGGTLVPISPYVADETVFLLARIDFNTGMVYAREVTEPFAPDVPESYVASSPLPFVGSDSMFRYLVIGGDYALANNRTYFDEFLVSTRLAHHIGIEAGVYSLSSISLQDITQTSATAYVNVAGLGNDGILYLDVVDNATSTTNTISTSDIIVGSTPIALTGLTPATTYSLYAYVLVDGEINGTTARTSLDTVGSPVLENLSAQSITDSANKRCLRLSIDLTSPGLSPTTVELLAGMSADDLSVIGTSAATSIPMSFEVDSNLFSIGELVYFMARATCVVDGRTVTSTTPILNFYHNGNDTWTNATSDEDWNNALNWSHGIVPTRGIPAFINSVGGNLFSESDIATSNLLVECGNTAVNLDLKGHKFNMTRLVVGSGAKANFTLSYGHTNADELRIGGTGASKPSTFTLCGGRIETRSTDLGNTQGTHGGNSFVITNAANAALGDVRLGLPSGGPEGNHLSLYPGSSLSYTSISMCPGGDNTLSVDNASLWGHGQFTLTSRTGGNGTGTNTVTVANDSTWAAYGVDINFGWYNGRLYLLNGSVLDAQNIYLGSGNDQGSGNELVISNSIVRTSYINVPGDNRYRANTLRVFNDPGVSSNTLVYASSDIQIGCNSSRSGNGNQNNLFQLRGGSVILGRWLLVGGASSDDTGNTLDIAGASSSIQAQWLTLRNQAVLKIALPQNGFDTPELISISDKVSIATDTTLEINTTEARTGTYRLLKAVHFEGGIPPENIHVTHTSSQYVVVSVNENDSGEITVDVRPCGTVLYFR